MRIVCALLLLLAAGAAAAQPASLVADRVRIESDDTLIAEGNVEVFYEGTSLSASRVIYDRETEGLTIEGPIRVTDADGEAVLLGDAAELEPGFRDGILTGARLVLDQQLQIAADELATIDGRYRRLTNAVASSCRVCSTSQTPLWEIRAARILHDTEERQIYFSRAQFRVVGVPVAYIPRLRLPDPTVERARGFLAPELRGTSELGQGLSVPYFIPLGRSADVTVAPWITPKTTTVELRYRQAFRSGAIEIDGAVSRDDIVPGETRSYVLADGRFNLPRDFRLDFEITAATDDTYADQYDYDTSSRLESFAEVTRYRENEFYDLALYHYDIVRPGSLDEGDETLVTIGYGAYERVFDTRAGRLTLGLDADVYDRDSDEEVIGRDSARIGTSLGWAAGAVLPAGVVLEAEAAVAADAYAIRRDPNYEPSELRLTPAAAVTLRWPLTRAAGGAYEMIEPVAQLAWADVSGGDVPDEDSRVVDFDEGNLFALDRFPGHDRSETGARLNLGVGYTRLESGWEVNGYVGRVLRFDDEYQFNEATGLNGEWSDWLVSGQVAVADALTVTNRAVFDDELDFSRNELRLALEAGAAEFAASYLWLEAEPEIDRDDDVNEAVFVAGYEFGRHWAGAVETRWDILEETFSRTDVGLTYRNECISVDLLVSRRYESNNYMDATYDFGVEVSLQGFGSSDASRYARTCPG